MSSPSRPAEDRFLRRDDRPRPSKPKKGVDPSASAPVVCSSCGIAYDPEKQTREFRTRSSDGAVVCCEDRQCRQRQLNNTLGRELKGDAWKDGGTFLFGQIPRELYSQRMDV